MPVLRLARVSTALAAVSNVWFVILWSRGASEERPTEELAAMPLWLALLCGAITAAALYAFGAALNDVLDAGRDRALRRGRPITTGAVSIETALVAVAGTLILAVLGATAFGTGAVVLTLLLALGILAFNVAGRFVPAVGLVLLALLYAGHALVPNTQLRFVWPVAWIMTHAIATGAVAHVVGRKSPPLTRRAVILAASGWLVAVIVLAWVQFRRSPEIPIVPGAARSLWPIWVTPFALIGPIALTAGFGLIALRRIRALGPGPRAAEKIARYGAMWTPLYGAAWLLTTGLIGEGILMLALAGTGVAGISGLREVYALVEHPVAYRR